MFCFCPIPATLLLDSGRSHIVPHAELTGPLLWVCSEGAPALAQRIGTLTSLEPLCRSCSSQQGAAVPPWRNMARDMVQAGRVHCFQFRCATVQFLATQKIGEIGHPTVPNTLNVLPMLQHLGGWFSQQRGGQGSFCSGPLWVQPADPQLHNQWLLLRFPATSV